MSMWTRLAQRPAGTVSAVFTIAAERKGAYRWLESPQVHWQPLADSLHRATATRCAQHDLIIVPIDGSSIAHTDRHHAHGVGSIGAHAQQGRGLKSMILLPLTYDGVPLGIGAHALWARSQTPHPTPHARRQLQDKESHWWTTLCQQFEDTLTSQKAKTKPWYQDDREADASHVLLRGATADSYLTVRANQDRVLNAKGLRRERLKLRAALEGSPAQGAMFLHVERTRQRAKRIARMEIRAVHVGVRLREQWSHRVLGDVSVTAVQVREVSPCPAGEEPIE